MFIGDTLLGRDQGDFQKTVLNFEARKQRKDSKIIRYTRNKQTNKQKKIHYL